MWPFQKEQHEIVTITLEPQHITLGWPSYVHTCSKHQVFSEAINKSATITSPQQITKEAKRKTIFINAYKKTLFQNLEFEKSIVFNPTKIGHIISTFIAAHNIKNPCIALSVTGPTIFEKIVTLTTASPTQNDFKITNLKHINWHYAYLGPSMKHGFHFYVCGIKRELLFQYQLLSIVSGIPLVTITTEKSAHLQLYKYVQKKHFRQSQLTIDLLHNQYNLHPLFTPEILEKNICIHEKIDVKSEARFLATHVGLFLLGSQYEKD